jgi:hypothetical protein
MNMRPLQATVVNLICGFIYDLCRNGCAGALLPARTIRVTGYMVGILALYLLLLLISPKLIARSLCLPACDQCTPDRYGARPAVIHGRV